MTEKIRRHEAWRMNILWWQYRFWSLVSGWCHRRQAKVTRTMMDLNNRVASRGVQGLA